MSQLTITSKDRALSTRLLQLLVVLLCVVIFLVSLELMSESFRSLSNDVVNQIIRATANPFISLFIGLLSTAIIQSSSTTTSMIVAIVASGRLGLETAIPIIMGANIGTTVTSTIVSMGHITKKKEFRKAIAAATLHDFFNILVVLILFPIEFFTGFLSHTSAEITSMIVSSNMGEGAHRISWFDIHEISVPLANFIDQHALIMMVISIFFLFASVRVFTTLIQSLLIGDIQHRMEEMIFKSPLRALGSGTLLTAIVQSSSVTTSLTVPLVATNKIGIKKVFPFLMGANIGTTVTAMLAAISKSEAAIGIAIAHLLFNLIGVLILFPIPSVRNIPVKLAKKLGRMTLRNRLIGFAYVVVTFFLLPFTLIFFSSDHDFVSEKMHQKPPTEIKQ